MSTIKSPKIQNILLGPNISQHTSNCYPIGKNTKLKISSMYIFFAQNEISTNPLTLVEIGKIVSKNRRPLCTVHLYKLDTLLTNCTPPKHFVLCSSLRCPLAE